MSKTALFAVSTTSLANHLQPLAKNTFIRVAGRYMWQSDEIDFMGLHARKTRTAWVDTHIHVYNIYVCIYIYIVI